MDLKDVREFLALKARKTLLERQLESVKEDIAIREKLLQDGFIEDGLDHVSMDGQTAYLHEQLWASLQGDRTEAHNALRGAGLAHLVHDNVNSNTLSAYVRELTENDEPIPKRLKPFVKVTKKFSVRVRRT